jgi:superfamily II DNA/RNA helicase
MADASPITLKGVKHFYVQLNENEQRDNTILDLCQCVGSAPVICVETIRAGESVCATLRDASLKPLYLHGDLEQEEALKVASDFEEARAHALVIADGMKNGSTTSLVVNWDLPTRLDRYVTRVGRNAEASGKRVAINLVCPEDSAGLKALEHRYNIQIEELPEDFAQYL